MQARTEAGGARPSHRQSRAIRIAGFLTFPQRFDLLVLHARVVEQRFALVRQSIDRGQFAAEEDGLRGQRGPRNACAREA